MIEHVQFAVIGLWKPQMAATTAEERAARIMGEALDLLAEELATPLLDASDEELEPVLDQQAERWEAPEITALREQLGALSARARREPVDPRTLRASLRAPGEVIAELERAFAFDAATSTALANRAAYLRGQPPSEQPQPGPAPPLLSGAYPPDVALLMLDHRRGIVALLALRLALAGRAVDEQRLLALSRATREGAWAMLRLAASLDGSDVDESIVPKAARLDWRELGRQRDRYVGRVSEAFARGRTSGLDVWPPIADT